MLYLYSSDAKVKIIVLDPGNIERLKQGKPIVTHDKSVLIAYTPDPVWLADKIMDTNGGVDAIGRLIEEASKRPEKPAPRPVHEPHLHHFGD